MADILDPLRSRGADGHRLAAVVEDFLAGRPLAKAWGAAQPDRAASMRLARDNALRALAAQEPGSDCRPGESGPPARPTLREQPMVARRPTLLCNTPRLRGDNR